MSMETSEWLNTMCLIGFTEQRGTAWHYRQADQGDEPNHYPGAVPVDDVLRRLFNFDVVERDLFVASSDGTRQNARLVEGRKAMTCSDNGDVLGIFKDGYTGHSYQEWLIENVATILDADLAIGSAGLLRNRGLAWVQVEMPETIKTPEGVDFRPSLLAATSFDGSLSSTFGSVVQVAVCDNTLSAALGEKDRQVKIKHSRYSQLRITEAREALAIVHTMADDFAEEVARLTAHKVSDNAFQRVLDLVLPLPDPTSKVKSSAPRKRQEIINLYREDERVAPWQGTAFGVVQAFNTWQHHVTTVKGDKGRVQRNYERAVLGNTGKFDGEILSAVYAATEHQPVLVG